MNGLSRRGLAGTIAGASLLGFNARAHADDGARSQGLDRGRVTLAVRIDGRGPFTFAIDSAANASVIAQDLAEALSLPSAGQVGMNTLIARETVETVLAGRVQTGALDTANVRFAVGTRLGLEGIDGLIGADLLHGLRLDLRFMGVQRARLMNSRRSATGFFDAGTQSVRLAHVTERRFGGLLAIDAMAVNVPVVAIIDTGALCSIANDAMATAAGMSPIVLRDGTDRGRVQSPTGRTASARAMMLPRLGLGGVSISSLPVLTGDFHTFGLWGLADRPAMLLGVDVLGLFRGVAIDLKRGEVAFEV